LHVEQLSATKAEEILGNWLVAADKRLTDEQWSQLLAMLNRCSSLLPLYLKLVYDIALLVRSYDTLDEQLLACTHTDELIVYLLSSLERVHGSRLVRHALCYMTVLKSGISDAEMEDLLSLDELVLYSIFQFHLPPVRRLPSVLWARIKCDLRGYIVEREADEVKVACWYHRRFVEVATRHYVQALTTDELRHTIYANIVDMYSEKWRKRAKPFELNDYLRHKYKNDKRAMCGEADRLVNAQPIKYIEQNGQIKYNKRKLSELPHCIMSMRGQIWVIY
jgi:NACHT domain- and WD repeat-containing protein